MVNVQQLMAFIEGSPHRRATLKQLLRELHIRAGERVALRGMLAGLVRQRRLVEKRHFYEAPARATDRREAEPGPGGGARRHAAETPGARAGARREAARHRPAAAGGGAAGAGPSRAGSTVAGGAMAGTIAGRISVHREGFAFVLPDDPAAAGKIQGDIFIPPPFVGGAMHGDTVAVRIIRRSAEGRAEGQVARILRRAHATVVGELHYAPGLAAYYVQPYDERLRERVMIPPAGIPADLLGGDEAERHRVLGAEARLPRAGDRGRAAREAAEIEGLVVDVEITQYPSAHGEAKGRVTEVLGRRDDFGVDVEIIIRKYHLPHRFPEEVLAEAERAPAVIAPADSAGRQDFRGLPIVTIDGETARDFDDAVYVRRVGNGGFELQVHIADVGHYVRPGMAMDQEARLRGTSVYFPDRAVPMLPIQLSTDLCSLRPHSERLVMSCLMRFDQTGRLEAYEIARGVIRSAARMTYTGVNAILNGAADAPGTAGADFAVMLELERLLNQRRRERGSIDFDMPEPEIAFDEFGLMRSIVKSERNVAHRIIEEFMLAANETVAGHLERLGVPSVYRIHEKPDPRKVAEFEEVAASFGYTLNVAVPMRRVRQRVRGQIRVVMTPSGEEMEITPRHYQKLIDQLAGKPEERIVSFLMLRSLQQARYSAANSGHFALAAPVYTHFTSPIRRYPDLLVHRILGAVLPPGGARMEWRGGRWQGAGGTEAAGAGNAAAASVERRGPQRGTPPQRAPLRAGDAGPAARPIYGIEELQVMAAESSEAERRADDAERELMDWKKVRFMEARIGQTFAAMILHVTKAGFFVELTDMFIEGFVPVGSLDDERFLYREGAHELVGEKSKRRYKVGDKLEVIVDRIDPIRHKIDFAPG